MKSTVHAPVHPWSQFYEEGVPEHLTYPDLTLGGVLAETARKSCLRTGSRTPSRAWA
ncbi:MAG: hypothetical protein H6R44_1147 [Nitrospirae bacterium]|nr:hypothetical protein [Nitrospirota bacterium]